MLLTVLLASAVAAASPVVVAESRCSTRYADQFQDQLRDYAKNPPDPQALDARFGDLQNVVSEAERERTILRGVCPNDPDYLAVASHIEIAEAMAYLQEGDIAQAEYHASCPDAELAVVAGFVAAGWFHVVASGLADPDLVKTVQARAQTVQLALPKPADTTSYWLKTVQASGQAAAKACAK
jgi:hypothetical protein